MTPITIIRFIDIAIGLTITPTWNTALTTTAIGTIAALVRPNPARRPSDMA